MRSALASACLAALLVSACGGGDGASRPDATGGTNGGGVDGGTAGAGGAGGSGGGSGSGGVDGAAAPDGPGGARADAGASADSGPGSAADAAPSSTSALVPAATGGSLRLGEATLFVPPGALPADTTMSMAVVPGGGLPEASSIVGAVYELGPDGLRFGKKVTLSLPLVRAVGTDMQAEIGWLDTAAGKWVPLASTSSASAVVAETDHFTKFAVRQVPKLARPTGRMMINGSASSLRMYEINLAGGDAVSRGYGTGPCLTKDGKVIYDDGNLVESALDGTAKRVIVKYNGDGNHATPWDSDFANPQVSPDDTRIAYVASDQIYVVDRAAGTLVAEFTVKGITEGYERPTWTPDGRIVVAGAFANPGLYVSDAALTTLTKFSPMIERPREPAVSPDGKQVAFVLASHVYFMNLDGTGLRQITTSSSDERYPFWSPDGKWIAMYGNFSVIAVPIPAAGAPPVDVRAPDVYDVLKRHPGGDNNRSYQSSWR